MSYVRTTVQTELGALDLYATAKGLSGVYFPDHRVPHWGVADEIVTAGQVEFFGLFLQELTEYLAGRRTMFSVALDTPFGSAFQKRVWSTLRDIPYGNVVSYGEQAKTLLKDPKAVRAMAAANGRNPLSIVVPCHRVIASTGDLQGYAGGLDLKKSLLQLEGHRFTGTKMLRESHT